MKKLLVAVVVGVGLVGLTVPAVAGPVAGKKILLKQGKKIVTLAKNQTGVEAPTQAQLDSATGAFLTVCSANGQQADVMLPLGNFSLNKKGILKYKVKGTADVKKILIKGGKTLKIVGKSSIIPMGETLGGVGYKLVVGEVENCAVFGAGSKDTGELFKAKDGTSPADCSDAAIGCVPLGSPSGAFLR